MKHFLIIFLMFNSVLVSAAFFEKRASGWFWYEKNKDPKKKKSPPKEERRPTPMQVIKKQRKNWENSLATAVLEPTKENVMGYLAESTKINEQAQNFAKAFKEAIWLNPQFDYSLHGPTNTQAIIAQNDLQNKENDQLLRKISQNHGLIFLFDSKCPVCHRFAPLLKKFETKYQFETLAVSQNGEPIPLYPQPEINQGFSEKVKNKIYPSLFLVNPQSGHITPISYGYADWNTLVIKTLAAYRRSK